jgi:hypothetical protein
MTTTFYEGELGRVKFENVLMPMLEMTRAGGILIAALHRHDFKSTS